ncbi:hypothetical protein F953_00455 [Acinetobacter junii CIP 107470 = MTCC 11364]|jgi:hypothetical protein|nr:hypothetical protein F953_00455 [Acinetobacter junii CIP 107470 = MTCC 11364]ULG20543.1 hypothetical protein ANMEGGLA_00117 [Acinetobacter nosocomialis]ULG20628.1 hypothetical protein ANMEGGLA_00202 [Acinetobacter nosocomialis]
MILGINHLVSPYLKQADALTCVKYSIIKHLINCLVVTSKVASIDRLFEQSNQTSNDSSP